jgi:hypothetical protein
VKKKRGKGKFYENRFVQKIPLYPPLPKGEERYEKDSGSGRNDKIEIKCYNTFTETKTFNKG